MAFLKTPSKALASLQNRLYRMEKEARTLKGTIERLKNKVAAAEAAARAADTLVQELLVKLEEQTHD